MAIGVNRGGDVKAGVAYVRISGRKLLGVLVSGFAVGTLARTGKRTIAVESDIPETAEFFTAYFDNARNCFVAVFEDESFPRVAEGALIPIRPTPVTTELSE